MTAEEAMARAVAQADAEDFGPGDFREGLERTLDAFARLPLTPAARVAAMGRIVADLANRLRIERWYADHPQVEDQRIEGPVLVCGLPRTGTTATVGMMATDPRYRFLRGWEAMSPVPPPRAGEEDNDPRAIAARDAARHYQNADQHIFDPDGPEEDFVFLAPLAMRGYHGAYPMPDDYLDWWANGDFAPAYAYHRRVLKLLQSQRPPNLWLLKAPVHLFALDAFAEQYPEARFVWTHRDPASVIPSVASLQHRLYSERCVEGSLDKLSAGPRALAFWAMGMRRALAARDRLGEHRFIDVWNSEVVARPAESFAALCDSLGFDFTPDQRGRIEDYNRRNARGAFGEHRYTAEEFGLTRDMIREAFADYVERFEL